MLKKFKMVLLLYLAFLNFNNFPMIFSFPIPLTSTLLPKILFQSLTETFKEKSEYVTL